MSRADLERVHAAHVERVAGIDPVLRLGLPDPSDAATVLTAGSRVAALADVTEVDPTSSAGLWVAARTHRLVLRCAEGSTAAEVDDVLDDFDALVDADPAASGADVVASVSIASRDVGLVGLLVARGFVPGTVLALNRDVRTDVPIAPAAGAAVRPAVASDLDEVLRAHVAVQAFDARFGSVPRRRGVAAVVRPALVGAMTGHPGWQWVAEVDGRVVGVCQLEPPEEVGWVTGAVDAGRVAYLTLLHVDPGTRGGGVGQALVGTAHAHARAQGVDAVLLHHGGLNPLSAPFWARAGYRPVVTGWVRRPASLRRT